ITLYHPAGSSRVARCAHCAHCLTLGQQAALCTGSAVRVPASTHLALTCLVCPVLGHGVICMVLISLRSSAAVALSVGQYEQLLRDGTRQPVKTMHRG